MAAPADLNLLFGVMAVQNDFISRDALIEAMGAWVLDKSRRLGEILVQRGDLSAERFALLDALVNEHIKLHDNDPEKSLAAAASVSSLRVQLSQIADPDLQASLHVAGSARAADLDSTELHVPREATPGLRYRILRPHAKGGLGEVFVAEDLELHREIALKEIQPDRAEDAASRGRFLLEAEVTGRLEHPGIVPVYGLGQYADGRPYYAMRFIHGDNLKEAIHRFHEAEKLKAAEQAEAIREKLAAEEPASLRRQLDLVLSLDSLAVVQRDMRDYEQAERAVSRAITLCEQIVKQSPETVAYRTSLGATHIELGKIQWLAGRYADAEASWDTGIKIM